MLTKLFCLKDLCEAYLKEDQKHVKKKVGSEGENGPGKITILWVWLKLVLLAFSYLFLSEDII